MNATTPIAASVIDTGNRRTTAQHHRLIELIAHATACSHFVLSVIELQVRHGTQLPVPKATVCETGPPTFVVEAFVF
jgi:hypothetical protein